MKQIESGWLRVMPLGTAVVAAAMCFIAACSGGDVSVNGDAATGDLSAFCAAYGRLTDLNRTHPKTPNEVRLLIEQERAAFHETVSSAPSEVRADITRSRALSLAGFDVIAKYDYDIDEAFAMASPDEQQLLNTLARAPEPGSAGATVPA
jgi:hypothetical protein